MSGGDVNGLTVACVLRSGGIYDAGWVARLARGVAAHLTLPHRFVCLSDVDVPCERLPLETDWPGWWSKLELFRPGLLTGPTLFFDLDTLIVGSLDRLGRHPHRFTMAHEYYRPGRMCSTAMAWTGDWGWIWQRMAAAPGRVQRHYAAGGRAVKATKRIGDQAFIEDALASRDVHPATFRDLFGETSIASYKVHARVSVPAGAAAVAFHGRPKPPDAGGWAQAMWEAA